LTLSDAAFMALVERKRRGLEHTREEIDELVSAYVAGKIVDGTFALWLQAVMDRGLSVDETARLTQAMASSGVMLSWNDVAGIVVDKHSTGGVGDDVSLIAVPLAAACGVKVAKLSGRGLGHTGGTIDKLECVPGLRTDLSVSSFKRQVADVGCSIAQATGEIAPADKKIYALRHRTQTVENIGLITASVLSKKIAGGAPHLVIDVKCGRSAFMQTHEQAHTLARMIADVGRRLGRSVSVLITDMEAPLAMSIGDALELDEAIAVLQGRAGGRLGEVVLAVAEAMLDVHADERLASARTAALQHALRDGAAYVHFAAMAAAQGGNVAAFERPAQAALTVSAPTKGFVAAIDGRTIGEAIASLKSVAEARSGSHIGIRLQKTVGDAVEKGEPLCLVFADDDALRLGKVALEALKITSDPPLRGPAVIERLRAEPM
jgi:pyrimidine-nucleoside phosphorylase